MTLTCAFGSPWPCGPCKFCVDELARGCLEFARGVFLNDWDSDGFTPAERKAQRKRTGTRKGEPDAAVTVSSAGLAQRGAQRDERQGPHMKISLRQVRDDGSTEWDVSWSEPSHRSRHVEAESRSR